MRLSVESERGARICQKINQSKENTPNEGRKAKPTCPRLGHVENEQKHGLAPKAAPLATKQVAAVR